MGCGAQKLNEHPVRTGEVVIPTFEKLGKSQSRFLRYGDDDKVWFIVEELLNKLLEYVPNTEYKGHHQLQPTTWL